MVLFIFGLILFFVAIVCALIAVARSSDERIGWGIGSGVIGALAVLFVLISCIQTVGTRNVGIETSFGKTAGELSNGLHFTAPWVNVTEMDAAIQTDSYTGDNCMNIRIAYQQKACVDVTIQWRINPKRADALFQNYHTFDHVRDALVTRELVAAVNRQMEAYNPLATAANGQANQSYASIAHNVTTQMRSEIGTQAGGSIEVLNTIIPFVSFDPQTQQRINQLQQQFALTRVAEQEQKTNAAQSKANQALASSVNNSQNVLVAQCFTILQDMVKNGQNVPAGFSCWPGGSGTSVIANASGH